MSRSRSSDRSGGNIFVVVVTTTPRPAASSSRASRYTAVVLPPAPVKQTVREMTLLGPGQMFVIEAFLLPAAVHDAGDRMLC